MADSCPNCGHPPCLAESAAYVTCVRPRDHSGHHRGAVGQTWPNTPAPEQPDGTDS